MLYRKGLKISDFSPAITMGDQEMIKAQLRGIDLTFETNEKVFSPKNIDQGTLAMLSVVDFQEIDKVLDLGFGYGIVGILAAKLLEQRKLLCLILMPKRWNCRRKIV
jgi:16S rRNA G1207 methylase RsmC